MPIYHFHTANGTRLNDDQGSDLIDDQAAQIEAIRFAGEMLRDRPQKLWDEGQWRVEVTNSLNEMLFTVITLAIDAPKPKLGYLVLDC